MFYDRQYAQLCSEKTLQADQEGFFLKFTENIAGKVGEAWIRNTFAKLKTDRERLRTVYEDQKISGCVMEFLSNVQEIYRGKNPDVSLMRRLEAEACLHDHKKALSLYSQSVLKAPPTHEHLSLALLGRSKLLMAMNEPSHALSDIQLCLKSQIPDKYKHEAFWVLSACYETLGDCEKSKIALKLAKTLGENKLVRLMKPSVGSTVQPIKTRPKTIPPISGPRHSKFAHASQKITLRSDPKLGRYIVANDAIKTGEILAVEPAHTACLLPEKFGTHCHHCFDRLVAPLGCPDCSSVAFCSLSCRDAAISSYHKHECKFLDLLIGSGMSVLSLAALRMITQEKRSDLIKRKNLGLCTNSGHRPAADFLQRTLMAAFLLRCLQKCHYFGDGDDAVVPTAQEYVVGEKLLYNLQMLQFNAHEVYETLYDADHNVKSGRPSYMGVAIYPTVALFNHDCYPAVTRYFVGKHLVLTSTRPLKPNDAIAENYGSTFTCRRLMERQRVLSARYWFNCQCAACLEDWPLLNDLINAKSVRLVRCPSSDCCSTFPLDNEAPHCTNCQKTVSLTANIEKLKWCEDQYKLGAQLVETNQIEEAKGVLCAALDVFHRVAAPPHFETHKAEDVLRRCLADSGNGCDCLVKK